MLVFSTEPSESRVLFASPEFALQLGSEVAKGKPMDETKRALLQLHSSTACDNSASLWDRLADYTKEEAGEKASRDLGEFVFTPNLQEEDSWKHFVARAGRISWKKQGACLLNMVEVTSNKKAQTEMLSKHYRNILLTTASHELMTPLNGILGGVQLIEGNNNMVEVKRYCEILTCSCKFLINITDDMHDYCLYESGSLVLTKEIINLKELMKEALKMVEVQARQRGVTVKLLYDENIPEPIYTDKKRLMQVFLNLLTNAAKYTFKGTIVFSAKNSDPLITIEITDTGIGISEAKQKSLFKLFAVPANATSNPRAYAGAGSGLGLTVSQALTRMLGTGISFSTREGQGSRFSFGLFKDLPRKRSEGTRRTHSPTPRNLRKRATIYVPLARRSKCRLLPPTNESSGVSPTNGSAFRRGRIDPAEFPQVLTVLKSRNSSVSSEVESLSVGEDEREGASPARSLSGYKLVLKNSFSLDFTPSSCACPDVLIVDDNAFNILVLKSLIEKLGLRCESVRNSHADRI